MASWTASTSLVVGFMLGVSYANEIFHVKSFENFVDVIMPIYTVFVLAVVWDWYNNLQCVEKTTKEKIIGKQHQINTIDQAEKADEHENCTGLTIDSFRDSNDPERRVNLSGVYRLIENINFDEVMKAEGIPWWKRNIALRGTVVQDCFHTPNEGTYTIHRRLGAPLVPPGTYNWYFDKWILFDGTFESGHCYNVKCEHLPDGVRSILKEADNKYVVEFFERLKILDNKVMKIADIVLTFPDGEIISAERIFERIEDE
mmetsp:Transcript_53276/g.64183  ORF Transcript_53276/g.64183 Transcript_53276/m.64183 type:complete len:258 (-) Transcript_53276:177-950(-)